MSTTAPTELNRPSLPPSVVILGNDAQLAARPATPVQLAHACLAAGYRAVIPASWGDELVAAATARLVAERRPGTTIHCACPHVARRVLAVGTELAPFLLSLVPPPVAAARYVRHFSPGGVRVTYVGRCPAASDDAIDARLTPEELLAQLAERGIRLEQQSPVFESVIPPDRRRHRSLPGGLPSPESLWGGPRPTIVDMVTDEDLASELADKLLADTNSLVDVAPFVGCVCAGAVRGAVPSEARASMTVMEPPRAPSPVVDELALGSLELPLPVAGRGGDVVVPPAPAPRWQAPAPERAPAPPPGAAESSPPEPGPRRPRLTPPGIESPVPGLARRRHPPAPRIVPGAVPLASDVEGRVLPRAYVARRRTPRTGTPTIPAAPAAETERPIVPSVEPVVAPPPPPPEAPAPPAKEPDVASSIAAHEMARTLRASGERVVVGARAMARRSPRAVLAIAVTAMAVLLGVAIGYAAANRRVPASASSAVRAGDGGAYIPDETAGVVIDPAPSTSRAVPNRDRTRATAPRPGARVGATALQAERSARRSESADRAAAQLPSPSVSVAPDSSPATTTVPAAPVPVDSAAIRRVAAARADSLERAAIRRELALRRARLDSIARRISEIGPPDAPR